MKLGVCTDYKNAEQAARAGFDYIECSFSGIAGMPDGEYQRLADGIGKLALPIRKCNVFLPADVPPLGPDACERVQRGYLAKAFERAARLGVELVVFGSGKARGVPEGWSFARAWKQLADFLDLAAEYAEAHGVTIALEPLRRKECNLLNYVSEATLLCGVVNHPRVAVLGDTFHMRSVGEPWDALKHAGERLVHIHISHTLPDLSGRVYPRAGDGEDYAEIFRALKEMGYRGDVSIEAGCKDLLAEGTAAVAYLKPLMA